MADIAADGDACNIHDELGMMLGSSQKFARDFSAGFSAIAALLLAIAVPASAHNGPPFPIVEKRAVGPFVIDLWTHPDLGYGTFFVIAYPAPGATIPNDLKMQVAVQPESGRLPEKSYEMWRDPVRNQVQFDNNKVEFDQQEYWRVRVTFQSSAGGGELLSRVEPTPTGLGKWDLLLYALPFAFVGIMWFRGMSRRRQIIRKHTAAARRIHPVIVSGGKTAANPTREMREGQRVAIS